MVCVSRRLSVVVAVLVLNLFAWPHDVQAQSKSFTQPMADNGAVVTVTFDPYGELSMAAMVVPVNGKVAVCGFWAETKRLSPYIRSSNLPTRVRGSATIKLKNKVLQRGVSYFREVAQDSFAVGEKASCKLTRHAWSDGYAGQSIQIVVPRMRTIN